MPLREDKLAAEEPKINHPKHHDDDYHHVQLYVAVSVLVPILVKPRLPPNRWVLAESALRLVDEEI